MKLARSLFPVTADRNSALAIVADETTRELIARVLEDNDTFGDHVVQGTIETALSELRGGNVPRRLIIDLSLSPAPIDDIQAIRAAGGPDLGIVALGTVNDVELFRELIRAGVSDYLVKPVTAEALGAALTNSGHRPEPSPSTGDGQGKLAVFVGTRGGVGTTTCAINTAWILAQEFNQRTALVDLDLYFGTVALALDIDPGRGLREALEQPARIDSLFVDRAMVRQGEKLSVLSAEEPVEEDAQIAEGAFGILLHELRQKFDWVVVDAPRALTGPGCELLQTASHIAIVAEPTLAGLRDAVRLNVYIQKEAATARLLVLDGGAGRAQRSQVSRTDFEKGLGRKLDIAVPFDPKAMSMSANAGRALVAAAGTSPTAKAFRDLVLVLAGPRPLPKRAALWQRLIKG